MKKSILVLGIIILFFCSCEQSNVRTEDEIPTTVAKLASTNTFDTLTVIQDEEKLYIYKKGEYVSTTRLRTSEPKAILVGLLLGTLVGIGIVSALKS